MPEHPPPPPTGVTESATTMIQWIKDVVTGPYSDKVKEEAIANAYE